MRLPALVVLLLFIFAHSAVAADLKAKTQTNVPFEFSLAAGQNRSPTRRLATLESDKNIQVWGQLYVDAGPDGRMVYLITRLDGSSVEISPPSYQSQVDHGISVDVFVSRTYVRVGQLFRSRISYQ